MNQGREADETAVRLQNRLTLSLSHQGKLWQQVDA